MGGVRGAAVRNGRHGRAVPPHCRSPMPILASSSWEVILYGADGRRLVARLAGVLAQLEEMRGLWARSQHAPCGGPSVGALSWDTCASRTGSLCEPLDPLQKHRATTAWQYLRKVLCATPLGDCRALLRSVDRDM